MDIKKLIFKILILFCAFLIICAFIFMINSFEDVEVTDEEDTIIKTEESEAIIIEVPEMDE